MQMDEADQFGPPFFVNTITSMVKVAFTIGAIELQLAFHQPKHSFDRLATWSFYSSTLFSLRLLF